MFRLPFHEFILSAIPFFFFFVDDISWPIRRLNLMLTLCMINVLRRLSFVIFRPNSSNLNVFNEHCPHAALWYVFSLGLIGKCFQRYKEKTILKKKFNRYDLYCLSYTCSLMRITLWPTTANLISHHPSQPAPL